MANKQIKRVDEFPLNPKDILSSFDVIGMSSQEFGIYCKMLFVSWIQRVQCFLPYDEHNICELCNITPDEWVKSKVKVLKKFSTKQFDGATYIYNERLLNLYSDIISTDKKTKGKQLSAQAELLAYSFDQFWDDYDKKVGSKDRLIPKWLKLSDVDRDAIRADIPKRKAAQPDKKFRSNPETYLNGRLWENEIINYSKSKTPGIKYDDQKDTPV